MAVDFTATAELAAPLRALRDLGRSPGFTTIPLPRSFDPAALLHEPLANEIVASYERPDRDLALVAIGEAARVECAPGAGPASLRGEMRRLLAGAGAGRALRPRMLGGFAFRTDRTPRAPWTEFGCGRLVLPRALFVRDGDERGIVIAPGVDAGEVEETLRRVLSTNGNGHSNGAGWPGDGASKTAASFAYHEDIDRPDWLASVAEVAAEVRAGLYEKVVLAAAVELVRDRPVAVGEAMARLRAGYPHCHLFTFREGDATFLGASPELLVELHGGVVDALGLAGSWPRGATPEEDARLARELLDSAKNRIEHEIVVRALREGLQHVTEGLLAPNQPHVLQLRNIQHLATEVRARAVEGVDVLELVERLHPTPAVCGWPTDAALRVIESHERFERGWYAGPVGWVDGAGDGEFAVALRSALVRGERGWLFAGAGIMGDSRPEDELAEIELKLAPLAGALENGAARER